MMQERERRRANVSDDQREAAGEVIAGTAVEPHPLTILAGDHSESIVLNLMQPQAAGRQRVGSGGGTPKTASGPSKHAWALFSGGRRRGLGETASKSLRKGWLAGGQ